MFSITKAALTDLDILLALSRETFNTAFRHLNNADDFDAYFAVAFSREKLLAELHDPNSHFYFALIDDEPAGYIKLNYANAQTEFGNKNEVEVERIYVLATQQGNQIGKRLLDFAIEKARENKMEYIWLGVWENNHGAIRFYEQNGFKAFSSHVFVLGADKQTDILMKKAIAQ